MELNVQLKTIRHLGQEAYAEAFFDSMFMWGNPPTHYSTFEPITTELHETPSSKAAFVDVWMSQAQQPFGQLLVRRRGKKSYYASVQFLRGPRATFNSVSFYGLSSVFVRDRTQRFLLLKCTDRLCSLLPVSYGRICTQADFECKNLILDYRHPDGSIQPRRPIGEDWTVSLPGVYWCNYFGEPYTSWFGLEKLLSTPAYDVIRIADRCVKILAYEDAEDSGTQAAFDAEARIRNYLGKAAFFAKGDNAAAFETPDHDLSEFQP